MSNESTEKVFFEIGVGEDPKAITALESLAKRIEQMQAQMLAGVRNVEQAAKAAEAAVGRAGSAAASTSAASAASGRPSTSMPGSYTASFPATVPVSSRPAPTAPASAAPPSTRMPVPFATNPSGAPASGRGTSSMPVPFATVPPNVFAPSPAAPPGAAPASASAPMPLGGNAAGVGPDALERMDKFAKSSEKAFKGVIDLGRGMALLGLVSEENSQKFLQSLVAIEGVVSTIKGGADLAEGLSGLMRGGAGRAAASAAATGAAGAASSGGFLATTVGGVGVGVAGTVAASVAAIASVGLVAVELKEIFSGTANEVGSVTDTIATWEVSMVSWMGEMTGWFDLVGNAATKEAEAKSQLYKLEQERIDAIKGAELEAARTREFGQSANNEKYLRFASSAGAGVDSPLQAEVSIYADALGKYQYSMKQIAEMQASGSEGSKEYADQIERAAQYSAKIEQAQQAIVGLEKQAGKEKVDAAQKSIDLARQELDSRMKMLDALQEQRMTAAERFAAMDDLQKSEAIQALRQAQTQGATSLSDQQRSLLRNVGGSEATKFAREADLAEARAAGFDTSFGMGFDREQARLEGERAKFTAVIQEQNQIIINVQDRTDQVVANIVKEYGKVIQDSNREIARRVQEDAQKRVQQVNQEFTNSQRALKQARG